MSDKKNQNNNEKLTDHNYDGIQELDNSLPRWWLASFYLTIFFAIGYYAYFELGSGPTLKQEFEEEIAAVESQKAAIPHSPFPNVEKLASAQKDPGKISTGKGLFQSRCIACHGDKGQGMIGPNLTDDYWIHGDGKIGAIAKTIYDGVPEKGMPPWGSLLSEEEVYAVTAYVKSLRGTDPAGAKPAQGQLVKE